MSFTIVHYEDMIPKYMEDAMFLFSDTKSLMYEGRRVAYYHVMGDRIEVSTEPKTSTKRILQRRIPAKTKQS